MPVPGFLGHAWAFFLIVVGLLSGVLAVVREVQLMYHPPTAESRRVFWGFVRIAFIVAAVLLWADEHSKVTQLSSAKPSPPIQVNMPPAQVVVAPSPKDKNEKDQIADMQGKLTALKQSNNRMRIVNQNPDFNPALLSQYRYANRFEIQTSEEIAAPFELVLKFSDKAGYLNFLDEGGLHGKVDPLTLQTNQVVIYYRAFDRPEPTRWLTKQVMEMVVYADERAYMLRALKFV